MRDFYVVSYGGDCFAAESLSEAFELASLEPRKVGYWGIFNATDAGAARLKLGTQQGGWVEFNTDHDGNVVGGNR